MRCQIRKEAQIHHPVRFVHHEHFHVSQLGGAAPGVIQKSAGCGHDDFVPRTEGRRLGGHPHSAIDGDRHGGRCPPPGPDTARWSGPPLHAWGPKPGRGYGCRGPEASRCTSGKRKASVFPLPVSAVAITSRPERAIGRTSCWTGVGVTMSRRPSACSRWGERPNSLKILLTSHTRGSLISPGRPASSRGDFL